MVGCINRLWRVVIAALVISVAVSCGGRDLSHDPEAVDKVMVEYLLTDFGQDIKAVNSNVSEINKVKLTRQDANPIVIVDVVYKDGRSTRELYGFSYKQVSAAVELLEENPKMTEQQLAESLSTSKIYAVALKEIVRRAKNVK